MKVIDKKHERALESIEKSENTKNISGRNRRLILLIDKCHKISLFHKIKAKFFECKICKELEGLR